jgi:hypothetical protein
MALRQYGISKSGRKSKKYKYEMPDSIKSTVYTIEYTKKRHNLCVVMEMV